MYCAQSHTPLRYSSTFLKQFNNVPLCIGNNRWASAKTAAFPCRLHLGALLDDIALTVLTYWRSSKLMAWRRPGLPHHKPRTVFCKIAIHTKLQRYIKSAINIGSY